MKQQQILKIALGAFLVLCITLVMFVTAHTHTQTCHWFEDHSAICEHPHKIIQNPNA
jgi:hypothetical protein